MQYKNYSKPSNSKFNFYDNWKPWNQKSQSKPQEKGAYFSFVESPHNYWQRKPKPNLSKHLHQSYQSSYHDSQSKLYRDGHKLVLKSRSLKASENCTKIEPVSSKKSIPDHALMKNLLSGLSIFDEENGINLPREKNSIYRHKSLGNLKDSNRKTYDLKPNVKSSIDFTATSQIRRDFNDEDFRKYCRNYAKRSLAKLHHNTVELTPENFFTPKSCTDKMCPFNQQRYIGDGCFFKTYPKFIEEESKLTFFTHKRNIVQERKQFFEKKEKDIKEKIRLSKYKPSLTHLNSEKEHTTLNNFDGESVMELYRNAKIIGSNTTISRSKHSKVKLNHQQCYQKPIELFHPEYNFHKKNNNTDVRQSIINSIRTKIFKTPSLYSEEDDNFDSECKFPKFPKETRKAMSIIMNQKKVCKCKTKQVLNVGIQTSPTSSNHSFGYYYGLPCTKNLLCKKGYHRGRCDEELSRKLESICSEDCYCKRDDQYSSEALQSTFWSTKSKIHSSTKQNFTNEDSTYVNCSYAEYNSSIEDELCEDPTHYEYDNNPDLIIKNSDPEAKRTEVYKERASYVSCPVPSKMNGLNGHSNGDLNGCGDIITQNQQRGCWTIGLINSKYRYLTAETFGFKINANGTSLKKKQIWTLEPDLSSGGETCIYLKSHLDKYLAVDSFGNVTCESEEKEPGCKFQISVSEDGKGRWAFRNVVRGYFLGSSSDKLTCTAKVPTDAEFWHIHLAARPQVNLRSVGRKRFAHLSENLDEIHVDANIPWGEDTLFTLEFHADEDGKYALHTCNNKYLSNGGKLVDKCTEDCLFSAEYHSGQLALRDRNGQYLSPIGSKAVLKTRSNTVTKDELFSLEDSLPQASFVAALNARYVSVKQGVDVTANQDEISDHETFQLEFDWTTKRWYIRTMQDKYWTLETGGGIQASGDKRSSNALFDLVWQNDGSLAFRANNGRYVITKRSGHLYATADAIDDTCKYFFYLINRPILVLKCEQGFVGYRSGGNPKLECNKATYECIQVERADKGVIHFKGQNGKYWHVDSESVTADSDVPENFYLELREPTRLCIKTANGNYLTASKNGVFRLGDTSIENATQWEY